MSMMRDFPLFRRPVPAAAGVLAAATIAWVPVASAETAPGLIADLVERVSPAVVTVLATPEAAASASGSGDAPAGQASPFEEFFREFGMPRGMPAPDWPGERPHGRPDGVSLGSGFVIEADGYIVTNNHVVEDAAKVTVRFPDAREFAASVIGTDPQSDLALLRIDAQGLVALALGNSDAIRVGEDVIAVGNPFGLGGTVTRGIVSAMGRDIQAGPYLDFIQTDAAINRGNSGGPLLNLAGEVIGVNSQIYSPNGGSVGVGFAIPSNVVSTVVAQLREHGTVERGWLGVSIQPVTPAIASAIGLGDVRGAMVSDVIPGSPADGRLLSGDVILGFGDAAIDEVRDLPKLVAAARPGDSATVVVLRDGRETPVEITLGKLDADRLAAATPDAVGPLGEASSDRLGATLAPVTPDLREELQIGADTTGVVVTSLADDSKAAAAGVMVGDVIVSVAGQPVASPDDVTRTVAEAPADAVLIKVARGPARIFIGVPLV